MIKIEMLIADAGDRAKVSMKAKKLKGRAVTPMERAALEQIKRLIFGEPKPAEAKA